MAIIKCKMCGGDMEISADKTFGTCEYCGSTMTLPKVDDDQRAARFNRGNHFRRTGEFDKALSLYEHMVQEDENDAEAHWCCALCRFGIEYVEDPTTYEYIPTCHRASFDSILEDADYLAALEHSDGITRRQYQKDAAKIAEVQKGILATSQNEEPFDVFICYKESDDNGQRTRDSLMAQEIYYQLTEEGYRVFFSRITLEDKAGTEYEPYIFAALNSAKVMVAIGTRAEHFNAVWVKNEWSRFLAMMRKDRSKLLLPCYKDMDPYDLPEQLSVLQSYDMSKIGFVQDLIRGIRKVIGANEQKEPVKETVVVQQGGGANVASLLQRAYMFLEDGEWQSADEYCEKVLDIEPENARAYLGKLLVDKKLTEAVKLVQVNDDFTADKNWQKAEKFADHTFAEELKGIVQQKTDRLEAERIAAEKAAEERRIAEEKAAEERRIAEEKGKRIRKLLQDSHCPTAIAAGDFHTVGLCADGSVVACGDNRDGQCDVANWRNVVAIAAGSNYTVGLCEDGTVAACGDDAWGQCKVGGWHNIVAIATGGSFTVGLRADGTVAACGCNTEGQCDVGDWRNVVAISAGEYHTVGLCADGTVVTCGRNKDGRCKVGSWHNVVAIAAGGYHTVGLCENGSVVACGNNKFVGQCKVGGWRNVVAIAAGGTHTVGLCADGSVVACGANNDGQCNVNKWRNVVAIAAGGTHTVGLCADGSAVAYGAKGRGQCDVGDWRLFQSETELEAKAEEMSRRYEKLKQQAEKAAEERRIAEAKAAEERRIAEEKAAEERRIAAEKARKEKIAALNTEKSTLQTELANLKGLFTGKRRNEIETRLAEIDAELKKLEG